MSTSFQKIIDSPRPNLSFGTKVGAVLKNLLNHKEKTSDLLNGELLSLDLLEQKARTLATEHKVVKQAGNISKLKFDVKAQEANLLAAYKTLGEAAHQKKTIPPAAEWLLDNYPIILDQIREIKQDLPKGYYRQLPKLQKGALAGAPRVYAIASALVAHTDAKIELEQLLRFIVAYQSVAPLAMSELWAIPIMLRIGLVQKLSLLATNLLEEQNATKAADEWATRLLASINGNSKTTFSQLMAAYPKSSGTFAVRLFRRLSDNDGEEIAKQQVEWMENRIVAQFGSVEALIRSENQRHATYQTLAGNIITSMRTLSNINWADWFERVSLVEQILNRDPLAVYSSSTFATRDRYRHEVERIARRTKQPEVEIAWQLVSEAQKATKAEKSVRSHVGYYLLGKGRNAFERSLGYHSNLEETLRRFLLKQADPLYLGAMSIGTAGLVWAGLKISRLKLKSPLTALVAGLTVFPASEVAQQVLNWAVTRALPPYLLPRLDLSEGILPELRTMVVVPMLLLTKDSVEHQFDRLEVTFLANSDPHLHFALLSDFSDAPAAEMPEDDSLLEVALRRVAELNSYYGADRFFFFHRQRVWNESQKCFMGWERKRGKLEEFNRLLVGADDTTFRVQVGELEILSQIRYIITLDADTQLPRDSAKKLIGTLAHPLNQAVVDPQTRKVVSGYGILQPRIGIDPLSAISSRFTRLFVGNVGIDPYTTAVSNAYMDLFGEGIFTGKGIYDPAVLRQVLADRFPENALLSHDLIEGNYARTGLLADVELLDSYPKTYSAYAARLHRWVRGDWQIIYWLGRSVPTASGNRVRNVLSGMARYKILDNLRRSLVPFVSLVLLFVGWLFIPGSVLGWTLLVLLPLATPLLLNLLESLVSLLSSPNLIANFRARLENLRAEIARVAVNLTFLADQAILGLDAILRTLVRLSVTHRKLLEWETAEQAQSRLSTSHDYLLKRLLVLFPIGAILVGLANKKRLPKAAVAALPVWAYWLAAPAVAAWLDQPSKQPSATLKEEEITLLQRLARSYWDYFDTFVTEEGNFLAPDNFQETPQPVIAYRTSPTNIGLQLLADISAHSFGYIGLNQLTARTEQVFATLAKLEHFEGHLLNWYDTCTLKPLPPAYVSTVDSGNLAGYLLTLRQGYLDLLKQPIISPKCLSGLYDTVLMLQHHLAFSNDEFKELEALINQLPQQLDDYVEILRAIEKKAQNLPSEGKAAKWVRRLQEQVHSWLDDITSLLSWLETPLLPEAPAELMALYQNVPTLGQLPDLITQAMTVLSEHDPLREKLQQAFQNITTLCKRQAAIADEALRQVQAMNFRFLFNDERKLFAIGYRVEDNKRDNSYYDLLASEARLASFIAIAKGDIPQEHWFHMGRGLNAVEGGAVLLSWSGTMFEYLMPLLLMQNYPETLLDQTYRAAVAHQIKYGQQYKVPWGVSESAYNMRDLNQNYQYRAFGVPGLGLKRGLGSDLVIAPYATVLALLVTPQLAMENIKHLLELGLEGEHGLYEAIDYTVDRLPPQKKHMVIYNYMVHHQGMSLLALDNFLHQNHLQTLFHNEPMVQATEMLLQEQLPRHAQSQDLPEIAETDRSAYMPDTLTVRQFSTPHTPVPYTHLLSNGDYTLVVTNAGGGFSQYKGLAVTRWHEDTTRDTWGNFCYIRDVNSGTVWSAAYQPTCHALEDYKVVYSLHKSDFQQQKEGIRTVMEVTVSAEDSAEVRHLTLTNLTDRTREIELTSYAEIVLAAAAADNAHPAFSNLFIETEFLADRQAILASRRPRAAEQTRIFAVHVIAVRGHSMGAVEYETDRAAFIGRGRVLAQPQALEGALSNSSGAVLDPIFSLRRRVRIAPHGSVDVTFTTAVAESREQALLLADKYYDHRMVERAFELAWAQNQVEINNLGITTSDAHRFQRLGARTIYSDSWMRAQPDILKRNSKGQSGLWSYGISGDYPIILVHISDTEQFPLVRELLLAHEYWRVNNLMVDLVILNEQVGGYNQELQDQLLSLIRSNRAGSWLDRNGGIFVVRGDTMPEADRILLQTVARSILWGTKGDLGQHLHAQTQTPNPALPALPFKPTRPAPLALNGATTQAAVTLSEAKGLNSESTLPKLDLILENQYGGFTPDGKEYIINLEAGKATPAPWTNVLANEHFGCIVTERGGGYTWAENSRENRLTQWSNDPVTDYCGEVLYLRNDANGALWSPMPYPLDSRAYRVRHGWGYSAFEHVENEVRSELTIFVPPADPVKLFRLKLQNNSDKTYKLSATLYVEWVLGVLREQTAPYIVTEHHAQDSIITARNAYHPEYSERLAFMAATDPQISFTCDRREFIGRNGHLSQPAALEFSPLSGRAGAGFDPCTAVQVSFELAPNAEHEVVFLLGQADDYAKVQSLVSFYRGDEAILKALDLTAHTWHLLLQKVQVNTPDTKLNVILNGWLLYQSLVCRILARSAFYQSGGAYGFRDQLQDVMSLVFAAPALMREHILRAASRQFVEGDVQHWWHPPTGRGIRTNFSDDYLWLPYVTHYYVATSGDRAILDESVAFIEGRALKPGEAEYYDIPTVSSQAVSLYEHCIRAIEYGLGRMGAHGLPLMGAGDWNDGMNMVGHEGRGESVWVGWFLYLNLKQFATLADERGDSDRATRYRAETDRLQAALEEQAWDGAWYLRAFFDDGTPLGSALNQECRIDSIVQSWAVISGAAQPERAQEAMQSVEQNLIDYQNGLIKLFTPPFDKAPHNPGYIKGYVPGVRENGGQYTHAAIWVIWAYAMLGEGQKATELFSLINPITHAQNDPDRYKVEPYVIAADVYAVAPHTGRGGWTWYTGSAGWFYRLGVEMLLGLRREGDCLSFVPAIPPEWAEYSLIYRHGSAIYQIEIKNPHGAYTGVSSVNLDGADLPDQCVPLKDDGENHHVQVMLG